MPSTAPESLTEVGLDADIGAVREAGHRALDEMLDFLATVRDRPVWTAPPAATRRELADTEPPTDGEGFAHAYEDFKRLIRPHVLGNVHPRFWGWVIGASSTSGMLADMVAGAVNVNTWGADETGALAEAQVIGWFKRLFGFPDSASGLLVSSGSMANIVALTVARDVAAGETIAEDGLSGAPRLVAYCSDETHNSNDKAVALLGLGRRNLKKIATRPDYSIDIGALQAEIAADRAAGRVPFCVIGNCGTVNTGQIDDLPALRRLCDAERLWFHVDGAFGALLTLSDGLRHLAEGVQLGDSLAFDLHKWMNLPYDAACVLVRDGAAQARSFSPPASYLAKLDRGLAAGSHRFGQLGPDLSRGPRGIKVWLLIKAFGFRRFAQIVEQNVAQARHLASLIEAHPRLELVAPVATNVVCFRYRPEGMADRDLDAFNRELLMRIQESGVAAPSSTVLRGIFAIRLAIVNQRSRLHDFDGFVEDLLRMAEQI